MSDRICSQVGLDGVDLSTLTPQDWFFHAGTALYGYGFGAPFVLGGPLEDSDPGCGTAELHDVLVRVHYHIQYCEDVCKIV